LVLASHLLIWARMRAVELSLPVLVVVGSGLLGEQVRASTRELEPAGACEGLHRRERFKILFQHVEIEKLIQTVADATCRTFIVPDTVKGKISVIGPDHGRGEVDAEGFYAAFLAALEANGLTILRSGGFFRVIEKAKAGKSAIATVVDPDEPHVANDEMVTRLFRLRNVDLEAVRAVLMQLISPGAEMVPFPPDVLIVTELGSNLERIEKLLSQLDVAPPDPLRVVQVKFAPVQDVADKIQRVLDKGAAGGGKPSAPSAVGQLVVADERTNKLILRCSPGMLDRILQLLAELDVPLPGDGQVSVYPLKNAESKEVVATLEPLLQGARAKQPAGAPPNVVPSGTLFTGEVKVSASEATNGIVVMANPADYRTLARLIEQLDAPRRQIFLEAAILEIDLERDSDFGLSFHDVQYIDSLPVLFGTNYPGAPNTLNPSSLTSATGAFAVLEGPVLTNLSNRLGFNITQFGLILHALQQSSDVNVISTPHLLAMDNKEAVIHVGQKVPFQTGYTPAALQQAQSAGVNPAVNNISQLYAPITRENVELKLTVKPHIGDGDEVRLEIDEQTEEIASTDRVLGPTTSTRGTKTTIVGHDHRTVVLGGIMQDRVVEMVDKTPILGDIPLLGNLFRNTTKKKSKVNLLLLLTPHIVRSRNDFEAISERKRQERQKLIEQFWGEPGSGEPPVDFTYKLGPLAAIGAAIRYEENRPENGGRGNPGEHLVAPAHSLSPPFSDGSD